MNIAAASLVLHKPAIAPLTLAAALRRDWRGWLVQEKSDGQHEFLTHGGSVFNAERMPDGSRVVNDLIAVSGQDVRRESTTARWRCLNEFDRAGALPTNARLSRTGNGVEMIEYESGRNGPADIVVCKPLAAPFGVEWCKIKFAVPSLAVVSALDHARCSVTLADAVTGCERGKLPLRGGRFERVRVGSILKVVSAGHTARGLLREARPDTDTPQSWLVKF
ncbi:MAG: hypothetical protein WCS42_13100 [Verrucomicrobiota bacterium]